MKNKKAPKVSYQPVGVFSFEDRVGLLACKSGLLKSELWIYWSNDGEAFFGNAEKVEIKNGNRKEVIAKCSDFSITKQGDGYVMTYLRHEMRNSWLVTATSDDVYDWKVIAVAPSVKDKAVLVPHSGDEGDYLMYLGGLFIRRSNSKNLKVWKEHEYLIFTSRPHEFDNGHLRLMGSYATPKGIVVFYDASFKDKKTWVIQAGAVLLAHDDPSRVIWRSDAPLWKELVDVTHEKIKPLGTVLFQKHIYFFWVTDTHTILKSKIPAIFEATSEDKPRKGLELKRYHKNPIIDPKPHSQWESEAVFNPAAIYDDGRVHLIYRAIGGSGISVFGYSSSDDGLSFDTRLTYPIFEPVPGIDIIKKSKRGRQHRYNPSKYTSGGSWGGCEDPRAVKIGNRVYVSYSAFGGWNDIRIALTSISMKDLRNHNWNWRTPIYLSPPGETHKNWVIFPEKINGKFAVLHGIVPHILVDYVDDLENMDDYIRSERPTGVQPGRRGFWDGKVRGAGPPPLKTEHGWLVFYHATDTYDPNKYKLGAMILDLKDPTKVLYRTSKPILAPELHYENEGKPGVVYASGAIVKEDNLYVYYGGGDRVVCVAMVPLKEFLADMLKEVNVPFAFKNIKIS